MQARADLVIGANAYRSLSDYARALEPDGTYVMSGGGGTQIMQAIFQGLWLTMISRKKLRNFVAIAKREDLLIVKELLETGKIEPVIERTYPLQEVPEAIRRIEEEHARWCPWSPMWPDIAYTQPESGMSRIAHWSLMRTSI